MIDLDRKKALSRVLSDLTGLVHIYHYQNVKEPSTAFFSSEIKDTGAISKGEKILSRNIDGNPVETVRFSDELMWYIQGVGEGVTMKLKQFCRDVKLTNNIARLYDEVGVSLRIENPVLDITEIRGAEYVERASCDIVIQTFSEASAETYEIDEVTI
jgi:hypothetical protein